MAHAQAADPRAAKLWDATAHEHDMMATRLLGFWLYMLGDSLIFAALFAAYFVLDMPGGSFGGPTDHDVTHPIYAYGETVVLFTSVLAYGFAMVELKRDRPRAMMGFIALAFVIGMAFLGMEWHELGGLMSQGITPQRSAYLSIFFTILVVHGIHIAVGLLWMVVMFFQIWRSGFTLGVTYRLGNLKVFWLYQTLIWTFVFTFVYLKGTIG